MRSARLLAALVLVAVAGCTAPFGGPATLPASGESSLPARQRDVRLDTVEPCSLLDEEQIAMLQVGEGTSAMSLGPNPQPACSYFAISYPEEPLESYTVALDRGKGADILLEFASNSRLTAVGGLPAVEFNTDETPADLHCQIAIDVAEGQNLAVRYQYDGSTIPMTRALACDKAHTAAEMAVRTLLQQAGG